MRRGFLINSTVLVLIIPLLLLFATYEDVSSQILQAQAERVHLERTENVVGFLNLEFQRFLEIAGKRAVVTVVDYVSTTGNFIDSNYGANNSIRDLILTGSSSSFSSGYNSQRMMGGQTIQSWLTNVSALLKKQGYEVQANLSKITSSTEITVALLDSFTVVIKARISQINITDSSGRIIYSGPIPSNGKYVYSFVDITNIEDAFFSAITGGRYYRPIVACEYPFPTLGIRSITIANASGSGNRNHYVGRFGTEFEYNGTHIWKENDFTVTNFTIGGVPVTTDTVINKDGDTGVVVFEGIPSGPTSALWWVNEKDEWVDNTLSGSNYQITNDGLELEKYWKVLWQDLSMHPVEGNQYTLIAMVGIVPNALKYEWDTELKIDRKWWQTRKVYIKLDLPQGTDIIMSTKSRSWKSLSSRFTTNPSNARIYLKTSSSKSAGYTRNNIIKGLIYKTNGEWTSIVWNPNIEVAAKIQQLNITTELKQNGMIYAQIGVDTNNDGIIDYWSSRYRLSNGLNILNDINLPEGYRWQLKFTLEITDSLDLAHSPIIRGYSLYVRVPSKSTYKSRVYDIQSFIDCLEGMKYFAIENGWSFFERLEGSNQNHRNYVILSESVQRELGYSKRPIGLVSFMIPHAGYDPKLVGLLNSFGIGLGTIKSNSISNVDYYFMNYYFGGEAWRKNYGKKVGYPMLGVSSDAQNSAIDLEDVFYIDSDTATELFTHRGACDLLVDYNCRG